MITKIKVFINKKDNNSPLFIGEFKKDKNIHIFEYDNTIVDDKYSVALRMPVSQKIYIQKLELHPFFDMYIPEGYLYEIFKSILIKNYNLESSFNDFYILEMLASNITGRINFNNDKTKTEQPKSIDLEYIQSHDTFDTFKSLVNTFLRKNAISGVQPKTIVTVEENTSFTDKSAIQLTDYIVKTWGNEYPYLAENEYFCMQVAKYANIPIPKLILSKNKKFLIIKKFTDEYTGFEEILGLFGYNKNNKYTGSYEKVAKLLQQVLDKTDELEIFYKIIILNYLLGNGDAHLKNFGILYDYDLSNIRLAPAYDIVCTTAYIKNDKPALTLEGKKIWHKKDALINFGKKYCLLDTDKAFELYEECSESVYKVMQELVIYIKENPHFTEIGNRMIKFWDKQLCNSNNLINISR